MGENSANKMQSRYKTNRSKSYAQVDYANATSSLGNQMMATTLLTKQRISLEKQKQLVQKANNSIHDTPLHKGINKLNLVVEAKGPWVHW